jgi:hypothetical protein
MTLKIDKDNVLAAFQRGAIAVLNEFKIPPNWTSE